MAALAAAATALELAAGASAVALPVGPQRVVDAGAAPELAASAWNKGGWQWEDKDMSAWALARLKQTLTSGFDIDVPGGHIAIVDVEAKGDASVTMRKGRKMVLFDLSFTAKWEGTLVDAVTGATRGSGDGEVAVTDFDQDCLALGEGQGQAPKLEVPIEVKAAEDGGSADVALTELLKRHGLPLLKARMAGFVADLRAHGDV